MKTTSNRFLVALAFMTVLFYGCNKTFDEDNRINPADVNTSAFTPHVYGVLPTTDDMVFGLPVFSEELRVPRAYDPSHTLVTPDVRDQGQIGSCTAFCGTETAEILYYYKNNPNTWPSLLSPSFVYYCERVLILRQSITSDNGAYMVNIPQALQKYGDCLEKSYPYPTSNTSTAYKTPPTSAAMTEGLNFRIGQNKTSYGLVATGNVDAVKALLANNIPVMMGFNVYDIPPLYPLFETLNLTNFTYNPLTANGSLVRGAKLLGGHATPIVGWDDTKSGGSFLVMNSWGKSWGNAGFFWMPYTVYKSTKIVPRNNCYYATLN
jgi:C1A family cysteine protease